MAGRRRPSDPPPLEVRQFTPEQAGRAIQLLESRIAEVNALKTIRYNDPKVEVTEQRIRGNILEIFGENSREYRDHQYHNISGGDSITAVGYGEDPSYQQAQYQQDFEKGISRTTAMLGGLIDTVRERTDAHRPSARESVPETATGGVSNDVFVVHGRKPGPREEVARLLAKLGLKPIILHEQPSEGRTIIEKIEWRSDVGYAVVLLTADDRGGLIDADPSTYNPRARQNVILELGYFLGKLKRQRVCVLYEKGVEIPSDYQGVVYVPLDERGAWKFELAKEMRAVGFNIDLNLI